MYLNGFAFLPHFSWDTVYVPFLSKIENFTPVHL